MPLNNLSFARFRYAMGETDAEKKKKILGMTQTEIGLPIDLTHRWVVKNMVPFGPPNLKA